MSGSPELEVSLHDVPREVRKKVEGTPCRICGLKMHHTEIAELAVGFNVNAIVVDGVEPPEVELSYVHPQCALLIKEADERPETPPKKKRWKR
jgi:hypothetical protein